MNRLGLQAQRDFYNRVNTRGDVLETGATSTEKMGTGPDFKLQKK